MQDYYQLVGGLRVVAKKFLADNPEPENMKKAISLYSVCKTDKTMGAIILLCSNGMGEDAIILSRSIFELSITAEYILADGSDYRSKRFFSYDWIQRKQMYDYLNEVGLVKDINTPETKKIIKSIEREASKAQLVYKYTNLSWSDKSLYKMAEYLGRKSLYNTAYKVQCSVAHSSPRAMKEYIGEKDGQLILKTGPSGNLIDEALAISFSSYYIILRLYNRHFKKPCFAELMGLEEKFINLNK